MDPACESPGHARNASPVVAAVCAWEADKAAALLRSRTALAVKTMYSPWCLPGPPGGEGGQNFRSRPRLHGSVGREWGRGICHSLGGHLQGFHDELCCCVNVHGLFLALVVMDGDSMPVVITVSGSNTRRMSAGWAPMSVSIVHWQCPRKFLPNPRTRTRRLSCLAHGTLSLATVAGRCVAWVSFDWLGPCWFVPGITHRDPVRPPSFF